MRVGILGGTFDPPHVGHLAVARAARDALALDRVELVPVNTPPHRRPPAASAVDRMVMVALACQREPRLAPSPREILRGGVSFTFQTLADIVDERPEDDLFLVIGADSYDEMPTWRDVERVQQLAHLAVIPRPGGFGAAQLRPEDRPRLRAPGEPPPPEGKAVYTVPMTPMPVAARAIRERLAVGNDPREMLHPAVFEYIRRRGLYGCAMGAAQTA